MLDSSLVTSSIETHGSTVANVRERGGKRGQGSHCILEIVVCLPYLHITVQPRETMSHLQRICSDGF